MSYKDWTAKKEFKFNLEDFQKADLKDLVDKELVINDCDFIKVNDQTTGEKVDRLVVTTKDGRFFFCNSSIVRFRFVTRATLIYSTAPADAFTAAGVRPTLRCCGTITPWTPVHSAVRIIAPRL